jgi:ABC-type phosphate transport system substrate-binding protein
VPEPIYKAYFCSRNDPLGCDQPQKTLQEVPGAKFCLECGFPTPLAEKAEIRGSRGTYRILKALGKRGMGRLYQGIQLNDGQPIVVKEYLLPSRLFNQEEIRQRKDAFTRLAGVNPADGKTQDFRLLSSWEAIADERDGRCYLITRGTPNQSPSLSAYLAELQKKALQEAPENPIQTSMTALEVREVLNQVLQTLEFLHGQKFRFPSGQVQQGLAHGNLNLDSLLLFRAPSDQQFFIYVGDLAIWEKLFYPPLVQLADSSPADDLVALGYVGFYLLAGRDRDPNTGQLLNPQDARQWPLVDPALKKLLLRLMGLDEPFENAGAARQALFQLPKEEQFTDSAVSPLAEEEKTKTSRKPFLILGALALLFAAGILWNNYSAMRNGGMGSLGADARLPDFASVTGVPQGTFSYVTERDGTWNFVLRLRPESSLRLEEILQQPKQNVEMRHRPVVSTDLQAVSAAVETVRQNKANFAITSLVDKLPDSALDIKPIAYDGLFVFVASSKKANSLPRALKGQITFEQLRQLYTGQITNWKQLGGPDLPVKLYVPMEPEAVKIFQQRVLKNDPQQIATFQRLVTRLPTSTTQNQMFQDFDRGQSGGISFGILSKTFDQCSGYPLALAEGDKDPVQGLVQPNGEPVNPEVNLCAKVYRPAVQAFVSERNPYPLGYPLVVVYPKNNKIPPSGIKFAELLTTRQGQRLLSKTGLVPLQPLTP